MYWRHSLLALALTLTGCGAIQNSSRVIQPLDRPLIAGVGDTVIEIDTQESMPNAFGNADVFGRSRPTGKIVVTYLGLEQGRAAFERHTIRVQSNATTMNSTPIVIPRTSTTSYSGNTNVIGTMPGGTFSGNAMSSGTATTSAPPNVLPPSGSQTQIISQDRIRYYLDLLHDRRIVVEGNEILVDTATSSSVQYRIGVLK